MAEAVVRNSRWISVDDVEVKKYELVEVDGT